MITLHSAFAEDWSGNGICVLLPTECEIEEEAGGLYELTLTHPITEDLRAQAIERGMLIKAPVPARETPLIQISAEGHAEQAEHEVWKATAATGIYKNTRAAYQTFNIHELYQKGAKVNHNGKSYAATANTIGVSPPNVGWRRISTPNALLERIDADTELIYHSADGSRSKVTSPSGTTGYIATADIEYLRTDPYIPARPSYQAAVPARQVREQLFRIYSVEADSEERNVIAKARHISYDMTGNVIKSYVAANETPQDVLDGISLDLTNENDFRFYTNLTGDVNQDYARKNLIQAILDPDIGILPTQNAMLVRDNYDMFILANVENDRGVRIKYGKNLLGIKVTEDQSEIITRIIPVGKTKEGRPLLLPEVFVDSEHVYDYPNPIAKAIDYDDVQVKDATDDEPEVTTEQAYQLLRDKVAEEYAKGCDLPDFDVSIDFIHLGDTVEYDAFRNMQQVFLYDTVKADYEPMGIELAMQATGYKFDAVRERYKETKLSTKAVKKQDVLSAYELPDGGVGSTKIAYGAVGSQHMQDLAVLNAHIGNLAVNAAKIQDASIETAKIADAAITNAKVGTAAIDTANIKDASITDAKIGTAGIDFAKIKDLLAGTAIFTQGIGDELFIGRLYVTAANIAHLEVGELVFKDGDGNLWRLGVDGEGEVTATPVEVEYQNISDDALLNISEYTIYKSGTAPASPYVGQLWLNTSTDIVSRCTATSPSIVWEPTKSSELHTSYIAATEKGLEILSTGIIEVKAGGTLGIKSMGQLLLEAGSGVDINTTNFRIRDDDRELMTVDESGVRVGADILAAPNIIGNVPNTFEGGTIPWAGSFQASLNNIGKWLLAESTLTISGDISEDVMVPVFMGARLNIKFAAGTRFTGHIYFNNCANVYMYADAQNTTNIIGTGTETYVVFLNSSHIVMRNLHVSGKVRTSAADGTYAGVYCDNASTLSTEYCTVDRTKNFGILASRNCKIDVSNCKGGVSGGDYTTLANLGWGVYVTRNSDVSLASTCPFGPSGGAGQEGGEIRGTATNTPTDGTTPASPSTRSYAVNAGYTVKTTTSGSSSVTWSSGEPRQGSWTEIVPNPPYMSQAVDYKGFGLLLLSDAANIVSDRPAGKTIVSAKMKIRRDAEAGTSGTISCTLYQHNATSAPSGAPNTVLFAQAADAVSISPNQEISITLNASALAALNNGTCKGIGFKATGGYGRYDIYGELVVTYS